MRKVNPVRKSEIYSAVAKRLNLPVSTVRIVYEGYCRWIMKCLEEGAYDYINVLGIGTIKISKKYGKQGRRTEEKGTPESKDK